MKPHVVQSEFVTLFKLLKTLCELFVFNNLVTLLLCCIQNLLYLNLGIFI